MDKTFTKKQIAQSKKRSSNTQTLIQLLAVALLFLLASIDMFANTTHEDDMCVLACNSQINVSLNASCQAEITYDMVLEDPNNGGCLPNGPSAFTVIVKNANGAVIPTSPVVNSSHIGQNLTVEIHHNASGNYCWGQALIEDKLAPQITCPADITVACTDATDISVTGDAVISDCSGLSINVSDQATSFGCANPQSQIVRTWIATDPFGNQSSCSQTISIAQTDPTAVVFPANIDIDCVNPNTDPSNTGQPTINGNPIENGGACTFAISNTDQLLEICPGEYKILRDWTVIEWCSGSIQSQIQVIKVADGQGPAIGCPAPFTAGTTSGTSCQGDVILPAASVVDNCSPTIDVQINTPFGIVYGNGGLINDVPVGTHTITYSATDACGNNSTCTTTMTVEDDDSPTVVCDEFTVITLNSSGLAVVGAQVFDDGSHDNCCLGTFEVRRMDAGCGTSTAFAPNVTFCCEDIGSDVMVEMRVTDCNGNANSCMVTVNIDDKADPAIACPADIILQCGSNVADLSVTGNATATDACGILQVEYTDNTNLDGCGNGTVVRTFTATDLYGNVSTCSQTITVADNTPIQVVFPQDYDAMDCVTVDDLDPDDLPAANGYPQVIGDDCEQVGVNYHDQVLTVAAPACFKILRTWTLIDWCINDNEPNEPGYYQHIQVIKVFDNEAPVATCPADMNVSLTTGCVASVTLPQITDVQDCSDDIDVFVSSDLGVGYGPFNNVNAGVYYANYSITDNCGNTSFCQISITVADNEAPTPYCSNGLIVELTPIDTDGDGIYDDAIGETWASDFDAGSFDNCTDQSLLQFSFSQDVTDTGITLDCSNLFESSVTMWVTDAAGNQDFCIAPLFVQDNNGACDDGNFIPASALGLISDEMGESVEDVMVTVNEPSIAPVMTDENGMYEFTEIPMYEDYTFTPARTDGVGNGVTTYDMVLMQKHILQIELLDSPYKIIAADANRNGNVTTGDMVAVQKIILQLEDEFPNDNTSWRFVDAAYAFANPANPLAEAFPESHSENNISADVLDMDFVAVKVGDVNNSATPNFGASPEERTIGTLNFKLEDQTLKAGQTYDIPFYATDFESIIGYQATIGFGSNSLIINGVEGVNLNVTENNFGFAKIEEGAITTSWNDFQAQSFKADEPLFVLNVTAQREATLSELFTMNSDFTKAEAYNEAGDLLDVQLSFEQPIKDFIVYQNQPNPFAKSTQVSFVLPSSSNVKLSIYNMNGQLVNVVENAFERGQGAFEISKADLKGKGTYYYQVQSAFGIESGKMIVID